MNRRSFFGFAIGGMAAVPLALVGEHVEGFPRPASMPEPSKAAIRNWGQHVEVMVAEQEAIWQRRGGF
ncbi:hypothetical protein AB3480_00470 [Rhizobium mongolense]|uniref:hypothetical protein n=1 Tax=Rhizobium mongolense TaxID=57676 RepID=UPI0034A4EC1B